MDWILGRLACGSLADATGLIEQRADGASGEIHDVLTLCEQPTPALPGMTYGHHAPIPDEVWLPPDLWERRVESLRLLLVHGTVLVHCRLGVSRAPGLCAAYLIRCGMQPGEALAYVCAKRAVAQPHAETWRGIVEWARSTV